MGRGRVGVECIVIIGFAVDGSRKAVELAERCVRSGFYVSFAGPVTFACICSQENCGVQRNLFS